ncbi:MAG: hypothetical protein QMD36_03660 [Candidatus Aenigmarchaeota archaeon]|nr:hypothetical protein [Candidatus Aenigmarchaeota archaeon]
MSFLRIVKDYLLTRVGILKISSSLEFENVYIGGKSILSLLVAYVNSGFLSRMGVQKPVISIHPIKHEDRCSFDKSARFVLKETRQQFLGFMRMLGPVINF